jgi:hypothetical protein
MTRHFLQGRTEAELQWYQRRDFLKAAAAWTSMGGYAAAQAEARSNIVQMTGDALVNGKRLDPQQGIQTGDRVVTGPGANLVFVIGNSSFQLRQNSDLQVERGASVFAVSVLRLLTGAVVSAFGRGSNRQIVTPTMTAGIRGTGVYTEVPVNQNGRSYFCNCYGTVDVAANGGDRTTSQTVYHQSFWAEATPKNGRTLTAANAINHTDEELEYLAALIGDKTGWQLMGRKGIKDGRGYMDQQPGQMHPADMLGK